MMAAVVLQSRPSRRETAEIEASSLSHPITWDSTWDSNSAVKREFGCDQGTGTWCTPCSGHWTRGTSATRIVWHWQVSR